MFLDEVLVERVLQLGSDLVTGFAVRHAFNHPALNTAVYFLVHQTLGFTLCEKLIEETEKVKRKVGGRSANNENERNERQNQFRPETET